MEGFQQQHEEVEFGGGERVHFTDDSHQKWRDFTALPAIYTFFKPPFLCFENDMQIFERFLEQNKNIQIVIFSKRQEAINFLECQKKN